MRRITLARGPIPAVILVFALATKAHSGTVTFPEMGVSTTAPDGWTRSQLNSISCRFDKVDPKTSEVVASLVISALPSYGISLVECLAKEMDGHWQEIEGAILDSKPARHIRNLSEDRNFALRETYLAERDGVFIKLSASSSRDADYKKVLDEAVAGWHWQALESPAKYLAPATQPTKLLGGKITAILPEHMQSQEKDGTALCGLFNLKRQDSDLVVTFQFADRPAGMSLEETRTRYIAFINDNQQSDEPLVWNAMKGLPDRVVTQLTGKKVIGPSDPIYTQVAYVDGGDKLMLIIVAQICTTSPDDAKIYGKSFEAIVQSAKIVAN